MPIYKQSANSRRMTGGAPPAEYIAHPVTSDRLHFAWYKQIAFVNHNCATLAPLYIFDKCFSFPLKCVTCQILYLYFYHMDNNFCTYISSSLC